MTEIMRNLPKDLQREVWSFLGMKSLEMTPSAEAFWSFIDNVENYGSGYNDFYGNSFKNDYIVSLKYFQSKNIFYTEISNRNWIIFYKFIKIQKEINFDKYKHLDMGEVSLWMDSPSCDCSFWLEMDDFRNREKYNWKCFNCYKIDNNLLKDDDILEEIQCVNCSEELSVKDFKYYRDSENTSFWCSLCLEDDSVDKY